MSAPTESAPAPVSRRSWVVLGLILAIGIVMYATVVTIYNREGGYTTAVDSTQVAGDSVGLAVVIAPLAFDSEANTAQLHLSFQTEAAASLIGAGSELTENVRFVIDGSGGTQEIRFPKGSQLGDKDITINSSGGAWQYPFDVHEGPFFISGGTYEKQPDGSVITLDPLAVDVIQNADAQASGGLSGWDTEIAAQVGPTQTSVDTTFTRAFSVKVFAVVLLVLAAMLATATAVVAFLVSVGRRKAEIGLMSWTAALLFALPALRSFMPYSPPIGAGLDVYVYLWVMLTAIIAAIAMIIAWIRQSGWALFGHRPHVAKQPSDTSGDD